MAWASQRSRRAINYAFIVVSNRISGPSCIFPSYTWAPFQSKWGREKTAAASNRAAAVSSMPYAAFQYCKVIWFYKSGHFRIIHKRHSELLCSCALRQQLRHDHKPLVAGIRLDISRKMMADKTSNRNITEIAYRVGFNGRIESL